MVVQLKLLIFGELLNNSLLIKMLQYFFYFMLILFDLNPEFKLKFIVRSFFTKIKTIHQNKNGFYKNRTRSKKPGQTPVYFNPEIL